MNDPAAEKAGSPVAFISGASGGIGTTICRHLAGSVGLARNGVADDLQAVSDGRV